MIVRLIKQLIKIWQEFVEDFKDSLHDDDEGVCYG